MTRNKSHQEMSISVYNVSSHSHASRWLQC